MAKGGKREGAGRPPGSPNKVKQSLRELAREYTDDALQTLLTAMRTGDTTSARVSAAKEILDRGYGKASQVLAGDQDGGPIQALHKIILAGVAPGEDSNG